MAHKGWMLIAAMMAWSSVACDAAADPASGPCPITRAHYHLSSRAAFGLTFIHIGKQEGWLSDLALKLTPGDGHAYWFLFDAGSARYINVISTLDVTADGWRPPAGAGGDRPLGEMHYFAWSGNYRFDERVPTVGTPAPERIFLPDLADAMWYSASPRQGVSQGVFVLDGCR
jgi:hypothetical protein